MNDKPQAFEERAARWTLWSSPRIDEHLFWTLLDACDGHVLTLWRDPFRLDRLELTTQKRRALQQLTAVDPVVALERELSSLDPATRLLAGDDREFPTRAAALRVPPAFLYVRGDTAHLAAARAVAVVGSRDVDAEGARLAAKLGEDLARAGATVVSGGARGVDAYAHAGAMRHGHATIAFMPGGLDRLTPKSNRALFSKIEAHGALVTEYPLGATPRKHHFHRRNHLIAGFSDATVVVRAASRGGTMLTARAARELGRKLFVVPGSPEDRFATGCLDLLVEGAIPIRDAQDVFDAMGWTDDDARAPAKRLPEGLSPDEQALVEALARARDPLTLDELAAQIGAPLSRLQAAVLALEIAGVVLREAGARLRLTAGFCAAERAP